MLAFDIETTGLSALDGHVITVICTEDFGTRAKKAYEFARFQDDPVVFHELRDCILEDFEKAPTLCAFNGHRFDLPFMAVALDIPVETVMRWKAKMSDIFEVCKKKWQHTFSLNLLCEANKIPVKISSGLHAVQMAADGKFDALREYCEYDVSILNMLYEKRFILNPRNNAMMDLAEITGITLDYVYPEASQQTSKEKCLLAQDAYNKLRAPSPLSDGDMEAQVLYTPVKRQRMELVDLLEC
tara:strand:+ start:32924 stop:33649 length:726 start_codon:yes stop_codon:yes gene_type:complete